MELQMGEKSCYEKATLKGEPVFTLRGQDQSSPKTVAFWIQENIETAPAEKLRGALEIALKMRITLVRKAAD